MTYDIQIRVSDKRPKAIVRRMLVDGTGPRDYAGRDRMWERWWEIVDRQGYDFQTYRKFLRSQRWSLGEILAYLEWQVKYLGPGIDEREFDVEWETVAPVIKAQNLLAVEWIAPVEDRPTPHTTGDDLAAMDL